MFSKDNDKAEKLQHKIDELRAKISELKRDHANELLDIQLETREKEANMAYHLKEKDLELQYKLDEHRENLRSRVHELEVENAGLKATNEMLEIAVDISGDVVNIQDLVSELIAKLPNIDINNITVNAKTKTASKK